jgi:nucleoside-triphosphatase THEP1
VLKKYAFSERMENKLSEKWIKASITGTIWAASEIVLGSFLHNLKVPFSGNVLTAIGIVILISISYIWTEKGLIWRAGLVCALMKTMSPSAVIFGPMIAILAEAFLIESSVRLMGRTFAGYLTGAVLAMSWNLFQKIANYIIFYGANIIEVYNNLLRMAQKQLNIQTDIVWMPIIILLIVFALFGFLAGVTGIMVGRKMKDQPPEGVAAPVNNAVREFRRSAGTDFNHSILWLIADLILMVGCFFLLNYTSWFVWSVAVISVIVLWSTRYKRALRQLSRPKFWVFFVLITLITAFALSRAQNGQISWQQGLLTGIQMNFRAAVIIVGFAVLGTELYNPRIRNYFQKTAFRNLPLALELSAESLPFFIASVPDLKSLVKSPVSIFYQILAQAEKRLGEIRSKNTGFTRVFMVTGPVRGGKTTFIKEVIEYLRGNGIRPAGIISERIQDGAITTGYDVVNIETGERKAFLRQNDEAGHERIGRFSVCSEGLEAGRAILQTSSAGVIVIDEVGMLETNDRGWAPAIEKLLSGPARIILMSVRNSYADNVKRKWNLDNAVILETGKTSTREAVIAILNHTDFRQ